MDYISLTDMANAKESESRAADIIKNWLRTRYAIEFLSVWEQINNPNFKVVESDHFKMQAGLTSFVISASEWIEKTNAIGLVVKKGKYGGTYAHKDIAFEFGSAISVPFKLYLITEFQKLKEEEQKQLGWIYHTVGMIVPQNFENFWSGHYFPFIDSWEELQVSFNQICFGLYKQAFVSLRSGLELGLLSVYFNINMMVIMRKRVA